jgi:methionyl aminopeptidase
MKVDIKSKAQIDRMRVACRMSAEIRDICAKAVEPGMRTSEIDAIVRDYCLRNKVKASFFGYEGFPGALCVSVNDEVIHGIPGDRMIMPGDLVKCDVGVLTQGYNGDTSRTVMVGVSDPEVIRLVETTKKCLAAGIAAAGPGVHLGDVGYAIQKVAEDAGFGVVRDWIGHGVGRTVHEDPEVPNYGKPGTKLVLKPGMTIAIEPMITLTKAGAKTYVDRDNGWTVITADHCMAAHWEHTVAITDDGCEILTLPADYP